jgi:glycosyltransferase involved in cell wall biosynthesis
MKRKHIIQLAHPMREMLAEVVFGLKDFELAKSSLSLVVPNRNTPQTHSKPSFCHLFIIRILSMVAKLQKKIGLINFRFYAGRSCDLLVAHGGFLVTNKPYVTYIEKATQIYGYTAKNYNKHLSIFLIKSFLKSKRLKKILFLSDAAFRGMLNISSFDRETKALIKSKGVVVYPPIRRPKKSSFSRFGDELTCVRFLYISNDFYGKGGLELLHAFSRLKNEVKNIQLVLVTSIQSIRSEHYQNVANTAGVELHDFIFTREELFEKFFDRCHIFCYPTYSDSFSAVINEAISSCMPIITTDFYAIPERVKDGYNGYVCASPFVNYDEHYVIYSEHFTDQPDFYEKIRIFQESGRSQYIEEFLYEKMKLLAMDRKVLYQMALNSKNIFREHIDPDETRRRLNELFIESVKKST